MTKNVTRNGFYAKATVLTVLFAGLFSLSTLRAQEEPEYRMEIGGGAGLVAYEGDFNGSIVKGLRPMGGAVVKYKMNPRMAWAAQLSYGQLKGASDNVDTYYPMAVQNPITFKSSVTWLDLRYEYNFWAFGTGKEYRGARSLTPFITIGAGMAFAKPNESVAALQMPIGLGVKYKLQQRLNLTAEWVMHFTGSDRLDGVRDPYGIKSSGLFKNTDCFSTLQVSVTYDIWAKCKTCHNDREE